MVRKKKTITKKVTKIQAEKEIKAIRKVEAKLVKEWNPEIATVTVVGIILIVGITAFNGLMMNDLQNTIVSLENQIAAGPGTTTVVGSGSICLTACTFNADLKIELSPVVDGTECKETGKVKMVAFHSLTCPHCSAQLPILQGIEAEFGDKLDISYACVGTKEECEAVPNSPYMPYDEGLQLFEQHNLQGRGVPVVVIDCAYTRLGSYGSFDPDGEKVDLRKLINLFLGN